jgi:hypothetical protein
MGVRNTEIVGGKYFTPVQVSGFTVILLLLKHLLINEVGKSLPVKDVFYGSSIETTYYFHHTVLLKCYQILSTTDNLLKMSTYYKSHKLLWRSTSENIMLLSKDFLCIRFPLLGMKKRTESLTHHTTCTVNSSKNPFFPTWPAKNKIVQKIYKKVNMLKCYFPSYVMLCYVIPPPPTLPPPSLTPYWSR